MYEWLIQNKDLIKIFYGLIFAVICLTIVLKTDKLFRLSLHQGIRYFRNAFICFGLAFLIRYVFGAFTLYQSTIIPYNSAIKFIFEYFLIIAGFLLLYSLIWKKIESSGKPSYSSILNSRVAVFYFMALVIVILDFVWETYFFLFLSQVILFITATEISYSNYWKKGSKHKFLKFYFLAMILSLIAWALNAIALLWFNWAQEILIEVYVLNIIIFLLFLGGVIRVTKR